MNVSVPILSKTRRGFTPEFFSQGCLDVDEEIGTMKFLIVRTHQKRNFSQIEK